MGHRVSPGDSIPAPAHDANSATSLGSRPARRRRVVAILAGMSVLVSGGGLVAAQFIRSPAQVAADTAAPPATVLTAAVERRRLTSQQAMRGQVYPPVRYDIVPVAPPSGAVAALYLSKATPNVGSVIEPGQFLGEVSGRPLFALKGAVPAYRDLAMGAVGPDVTQLQQALRTLGYARGSDQAGVLGAGTARAVAAFYRDRGYPAPADAMASQHQQPTPSTSAASVTAHATGIAQNPQTGTTILPRGEAVFLPSYPATVVATAGAVGQPVSSALLTVVTAGLAVTGQLGPASQNQIKTGAKVTMTDDLSGTTAAGVVSALGEATTVPPAGTVVVIGGVGSAQSGTGGDGSRSGSASGADAYIPVSITPDQSLPSAWNGRNIRVVVEGAGSDGEVLAVPLSAIVTTANGTTTVTRLAANGTDTTVPVTTGISADGMVEVRPAGTEPLTVGDRVRVGR